MPNYTMIVASSSKEGREAEYESWYDNIHIKDVFSVTGVKSGRRLAARPDASPNPPPGAQIAIYEIETDDPVSIMQEIGQRTGSGEFGMTDAIDLQSTRIWFYSQA